MYVGIDRRKGKKEDTSLRRRQLDFPWVGEQRMTDDDFDTDDMPIMSIERIIERYGNKDD